MIKEKECFNIPKVHYEVEKIKHTYQNLRPFNVLHTIITQNLLHTFQEYSPV